MLKINKYLLVLGFVATLNCFLWIRTRSRSNVCQTTQSDSKINSKIIRHLLVALRYARTHNVRVNIVKALKLAKKDDVLYKVDVKEKKIAEVEKTDDSKMDVCLDEYKGVIDHPLYNQGQIEIECAKKPFDSVLTFVFLVENCDEVRTILQGVRTNYNLSSVIFGCKEDCGITDRNAIVLSVTNSSEGWLSLLQKVNTKYVLIAPNLYHFDNQSRIERLVQMVAYTDVHIAAGGVRLEDGRFYSGCYQMGMKMYTLKTLHGYDRSFNSCMYCDYSPAPFVTKTAFIMDYLSHNIESTGLLLFLDLFNDFVRSGFDQMLVCPDVLFHVKPYDLRLIRKSQWYPFVQKYELNRVMFDGGSDLNFTCEEARTSCSVSKGLVVPLCCMKELSDSLKFMKQIMDLQNVTFEVLEGTVMGGLKYNNILFWERDADTNFRVQMIDKLESRLKDISDRGYRMDISYECPFKRDHEKCRKAGYHGSIYYAYRTKNWRTEMYGVTYILSDFRGKLKNPTKILIDGEWYITYTNPVLYGRNIYGGDIFQHSEHYLTLGISHTEYAKLYRGNFESCPRPGFHGCLDNFYPEGGLQFQDIYL